MKSLAKQIASLVLVLLSTCSALAQTPVQVEIESVDVRNNSISVTHNGKSRKLAIAPNVEITLEGKKADLVSLLPGNTASVIYDKEAAAVTSIAAQRTAILPAEKLAEGWDEIDDRLIFLMVRLASTEASLEATENAIAASSRNQSRKTGQVRQADNKNNDMDRKGGGPVKWSLFYGRAAESFFYHPTDRNTTYHTETILFQQYPVNDNQAGPGVPSRQGLPVHQRPPQFDYIYRANESAKARAEKDLAQLIGKTDELIERRQRLEAEQAGLWCEVAFRSVSHYDLDKKPLYRFEPINAATDSDARVQLETIRSAASFMALALSIVEAAQKDQPATLSKIKPAVAKARQDMNDAWLRIGVDVTDRKSVEGKFHALAKKLEESASNLSESYLVALEGDMAKDQQRKDTFRGLLQESIIRYAEIILALDEMATLMKDDWTIKPDIDKPIRFVGLEKVEASWVLGSSAIATFNNVGIFESKSHLLFDGVSFEGLRLVVAPMQASKPSLQDAWGIDPKRKVLFATGIGNSWLATQSRFEQFKLEFEWRFPPNGKSSPNGGGVVLGVNGINEKGYDPRGIEIDLSDSERVGSFLCLDTNMSSSKGSTTNSSVRWLESTSKPSLKPTGSWNTTLIECRGREVTVFVNGQMVNKGTADSKLLGEICFRSQTTAIEFRELRITTNNTGH